MKLLDCAVDFVDARPEEFPGVPGIIASAAMRKLLTVTCRVARTSVPVLISGESGTGKELIARAVHHLSSRSGAFVDLNCAALPESELFGFETRGLLEAAQGGTLFLDEVSEMEPRVQAKLLRVLDGYSYFRPGSSGKVELDVRFVAATNIDLAEAVRASRFRGDLYHRLNGFHLVVPPLRSRPEDIAPLAQWFLRDRDVTVGREALSLLENYSWPGNVRELRNVINKAALFADSGKINPAELPTEVLFGMADDPADEYSLNDLEKQTICKVLEQTGGHQRKAAEVLGISTRTLIRKLKLYRSFQDRNPA